MKKAYIALALLPLFTLASCGAREGSEQEEASESISTEKAETVNKTETVNNQTDNSLTKAPDLKGHNPNFTTTSAEEQGYWYSRYTLGQLMARAGYGERMVPPDGAMPKMMAMIDGDFDITKLKAGDFSYGDKNHFMPPKNPYLIKTVYTSGNPSFTQKIDPSDFSTLRWDQSSMDKNYTGEAFGWMILKEGEWAKNFHNVDHFGAKTDDFGAQWRMTGMILTTEAKAQTMSYVELVKNGNIRMNKADKIVMLEALSSMYSLTSDKEKRPLTYDEKYANLAKTQAEKLYTELKKESFDTIRNASLMVQAEVWYLTEVKKDKSTLNIELKKHLDNLLVLSPTNATQKAYMIRALVEGQRILGNDSYNIDNLFNDLYSDFDQVNGYFKSQTKYSIDDIGSILGALNSLRIFDQKGVNKTDVDSLFTKVFESMVNMSGLMRSVPPIASSKDEWEYKGVDPMNFGYPTIAKPPMAGGDNGFGVAPVLAGEISFDTNTNTWKVTDNNFYTAGGMHTANEMIWFHHDEVNGFPEFNSVVK